MKHSDREKLTVEQCKDSGLALVLIFLIIYLVWKIHFFVLLAIGTLLVAMVYPIVFQPFARFWFGLSALLGTFGSKILLTLLFWGLVLPVGLVRRALGKDAMKIKSWRAGKESVFRNRNHLFIAEDLENPF